MVVRHFLSNCIQTREIHGLGIVGHNFELKCHELAISRHNVVEDYTIYLYDAFEDGLREREHLVKTNNMRYRELICRVLEEIYSPWTEF